MIRWRVSFLKKLCVHLLTNTKMPKCVNFNEILFHDICDKLKTREFHLNMKTIILFPPPPKKKNWSTENRALLIDWLIDRLTVCYLRSHSSIFYSNSESPVPRFETIKRRLCGYYYLIHPKIWSKTKLRK